MVLSYIEYKPKTRTYQPLMRRSSKNNSKHRGRRKWSRFVYVKKRNNASDPERVPQLNFEALQFLFQSKVPFGNV
jgi:hypothetical protein